MTKRALYQQPKRARQRQTGNLDPFGDTGFNVRQALIHNQTKFRKQAA
jgi:hypothetical protein